MAGLVPAMLMPNYAITCHKCGHCSVTEAVEIALSHEINAAQAGMKFLSFSNSKNGQLTS